MCGLAGFARAPGNGVVEQPLLIAENLLLSVANRGHHATGFATVGGEKPFLWKWAVPVTRALHSEPWKNQRKCVTEDTPYLLGHVRHATLNNAHVDQAAHPFRIGHVSGAHNGVIRNWKKLQSEVEGGEKWIVDSEAAFALLNKFEDPNEALDLLDGYWALTWTRDGALHMCRTNDAQLSAAYVPSIRALFWCSEREKLNRELRAMLPKDAEFSIWTLEANTIYRYRTELFTAEGANAEKIDAPFRARKNGKVDPRTQGIPDDARPTEWLDRGPTLGNTSGDGKGKRRPTSVVSFEPKKSAPPKRFDLDQMQVKGGTSLAGMEQVVRQLAGRVEELLDQRERDGVEIDLLQGRVESLEAEIAFLYEVLNEEGILGGRERDDEDDQLPFPALRSDARCKECGQGEEEGELLDLPKGEKIHASCISAELGRPSERLRVGLA
jgi:predicted glutamine amidotransferase